MYKTISFLRVSLITYHKHFRINKGNTNPVCILGRHFILFTMGYRMVFNMAISIVDKCFLLTKKIIGGPTFHSSIMPFILGSIFRGDSPMIVVSPYPQG